MSSHTIILAETDAANALPMMRRFMDFLTPYARESDMIALDMEKPWDLNLYGDAEA